MSQQFPNLQKVYSYQVLSLSFPWKISETVFLQKPTTEHAWAKEFYPLPHENSMFSKRLRFLDLKFLCLGWNYKLITTIMSLSLDERFWSWGKYIPTQFKWKISRVWAPPSHTPPLSPLPVLLQKHRKESWKKQGRKNNFLSRMQAKL